jgi:hypothetical protein
MLATLSQNFGKTPEFKSIEECRLKWKLMDLNLQLLCKLLEEEVDRNDKLMEQCIEIRAEIDRLIPEDDGEDWKR